MLGLFLFGGYMLKVLLVCMMYVCPLQASRGIDNLNYGNLRPEVNIRLHHQIGRDNMGFAVFDSPEAGIRAIRHNLMVYKTRYGINTVEGIILRWTAHDTASKREYIIFVSKQLKVKPTQALTFNKKQIVKLIQAIIIFESGHTPFTDKQIRQALK